VTVPLGVLTVVAAICAATMVIVYDARGLTGTLDMDPAAVLANADAVDLGYTYRAADGTESTGRFTITADGYATGSIADQFAGTATVHTTPEGSAVWGDEDWWSRRAPALAGTVKDQWVQPDAGTALPIDVAAEFNPGALAELIGDIEEHGTLDPDLTAYQGVPAVARTWEDWTLIRTQSLPPQVLSLSGPISDDLFHTAAAPASTVEVMPAVWEGDEMPAGHAQVGGAVGTLDVDIRVPPSPEVANYTKEQAAKTLNGENANPADPAAPSAPEDEPPPALTDFPVTAPSLSGTINASDCSTPTCSWSATVQNTGDGPGDVTVTASVSPGMGPVEHALGTIQPGGQATTPTMTMPNQAPTPAPGQTTSVTVMYSIIMYASQTGGSDAGRYRDLVNRLGGYTVQPRLEGILRPLATAAQDVAIEAMNDMLDQEVPVDDTLDAMDQATQADPAQGEYAETPLLRRLVEAGDRFTSWPSIVQQLNGVGAVDMPAYLPGLETAVEELANPAAPTVSLTYLPGELDAPMDAVVVSEYPTPEEVRCTGITTVPNGDLAAGIDRAVGNAAEHAEGCTVYSRIVIPDIVSPLGTAGARELIEQLGADVPGLAGCGDGSRFAGTTIDNETGRWAWTAPEICLESSVEVDRKAREMLDGLPQEVRDVLVQQKVITLGADGTVESIDWQDPEQGCKSEYGDVDAEQVPTGSTADRNGGPRALGSFAYLCEPLRLGQDPTVDPWDWPANHEETAPGVYPFARCHLVGEQMGGYGDGDNLVTCYQRTTNLKMLAFENQVRGSVTRDSHLLYIAVPIYNGPSDAPRLPSLGAIQLVAISPWMAISGTYANSAAGGYTPGDFIEVD